MKKAHLAICSLLLLYSSLFSQKPALTYYLPDIEYDSNIPTPEDYLGYMPGEWHISHDLLVGYMKALAAASDRIEIEEYARSYENRPLVLLTITDPENHRDLDNIRQQHIALSDPNLSNKLEVEQMPVVVYQGFSIHGNEPSGGNAVPLVAYYLAAGKSAEVNNLLKNSIILLDPCYNPDGFHRFSGWANTHKSLTLVSDPQDREYTEVWPRGRTNHYWFDLNRDWLPIQHPESKGRIKNFHLWKPNVLTDHHEMGSNSSFFFQPGIQTRTNPFTPKENQSLTFDIGKFHAATLDEIGSLYYTQESFDDFYYGKGSTYPDVNGAIGILFEQGSSRGHVQETNNGLLTFPFTIRNQVRTALSTQNAALDMKDKLLDYQRRFYQSSMDEARKDSKKAYVFSAKEDQARLGHFIDLLLAHKIDVYQTKADISTGGKVFFSKDSYLVPLEQTQHRLIKGMFENITTFEDSLFYDISAWTLPLSYNMQYETLSGNIFSNSILGTQITDASSFFEMETPAKSNYAYLMEWEGYYAPTALYQLQKAGLRTKVATQSFQTASGKSFDEGTILIPIQNQNLNADQIHALITEVSASTTTHFHAEATGLTPQGIDFGSNSFASLKKPNVLLLVGDGMSSYDAGEVWHLLDQRYHIPVTKIELDDVSRRDLDRYNVIVMVNGSYGKLGKGGTEKIKSFVREGGTLITFRDAIRWAKSNGLAGVEFIKSNASDNDEQRPYNKLRNDRGADVIGGAIFESTLDLTHPLAYGYKNATLPVFRRGTLFLKPTTNAYATPQTYTDQPLLGGYISNKNLDLLKNSANIVVGGAGRGKTICMADNPNFRAFWYGTNKLFANAIFFSPVISSGAVERSSKP